MRNPGLPPPPSADIAVLELGPGSEPLLQHFFADNPQYFESVNGEAPGPADVHEEIHGTLPAGWTCSRKWIIGYVDAQGCLLAMANVVADLLAPSVWHIGTFIVATSRHGSGLAGTVYGGIESWAAGLGARWIRLGVVQGDIRAERFWARQGFVQTRVRTDISMGRRVHTVRVMFKPLNGGSLAGYLALVGRDHPQA
jgi:GNAT superfamily N-acetyltransferase